MPKDITLGRTFEGAVRALDFQQITPADADLPRRCASLVVTGATGDLVVRTPLSPTANRTIPRAVIDKLNGVIDLELTQVRAATSATGIYGFFY